MRSKTVLTFKLLMPSLVVLLIILFLEVIPALPISVARLGVVGFFDYFLYVHLYRFITALIMALILSYIFAYRFDKNNLSYNTKSLVISLGIAFLVYLWIAVSSM